MVPGLRLIARVGWRTPNENPDVDPAHQALLLRKHFSDFFRAVFAQKQDDNLQRLLLNSQPISRGVEEALHRRHRLHYRIRRIAHRQRRTGFIVRSSDVAIGI